MSQSKYPTNPEVRAWADARFYDVPVRGYLPQWVIDEWDKAHPVRKYVKEQAHHGTPSGYSSGKCREACCRKAWLEYLTNHYAQLAEAA